MPGDRSQHFLSRRVAASTAAAAVAAAALAAALADPRHAAALAAALAAAFEQQASLGALLLEGIVRQHPHRLDGAAQELPRGHILRLLLGGLRGCLALLHLLLPCLAAPIGLVRTLVAAAVQVGLQLVECDTTRPLPAAARAGIEQPMYEASLRLTQPRRLGQNCLGCLALRTREPCKRRLARLHAPLLFGAQLGA